MELASPEYGNRFVDLRVFGYILDNIVTIDSGCVCRNDLNVTKASFVQHFAQNLQNELSP